MADSETTSLRTTKIRHLENLLHNSPHTTTELRRKIDATDWRLNRHINGYTIIELLFDLLTIYQNAFISFKKSNANMYNY